MSAQNSKTGSGSATASAAAFVPPVNDNFATAARIAGAGQHLSSQSRLRVTPVNPDRSSFNAARRNGEVRLTVTGNVSAPTSGEEGTGYDGSLLSVGPNPMAASGRVSPTVGTSQDVRVALFDALGREVRVLLDAPLAAGQQAYIGFLTAGLPPGVYVVRATSADVNLA